MSTSCYNNDRLIVCKREEVQHCHPSSHQNICHRSQLVAGSDFGYIPKVINLLISKADIMQHEVTIIMCIIIKDVLVVSLNRMGYATTANIIDSLKCPD